MWHLSLLLLFLELPSNFKNVFFEWPWKVNSTACGLKVCRSRDDHVGSVRSCYRATWIVYFWKFRKVSGYEMFRMFLKEIQKKFWQSLFQNWKPKAPKLPIWWKSWNFEFIFVQKIFPKYQRVKFWSDIRWRFHEPCFLTLVGSSKWTRTALSVRRWRTNTVPTYTVPV